MMILYLGWTRAYGICNVYRAVHMATTNTYCLIQSNKREVMGEKWSWELTEVVTRGRKTQIIE